MVSHIACVSYSSCVFVVCMGLGLGVLGDLGGWAGVFLFFVGVLLLFQAPNKMLNAPSLSFYSLPTHLYAMSDPSVRARAISVLQARCLVACQNPPPPPPLEMGI